jgi:hypothetical protein
MDEKPKRQPSDGGAADAYHRLVAKLSEHRTELASGSTIPECPDLAPLQALLVILPNVLTALADISSNPAQISLAQNQWQLLSESVQLGLRAASEPTLYIEWQAAPWQIRIAVGNVELSGVLDADLLLHWLAIWQREEAR